MESSKTYYCSLVAAALFGFFGPGPVSAGSVHGGSFVFQAQGTDRAAHSSRDFAESRATVLLFLATDCPISNRYAPVLHALESAYRQRGVRFLAVFPQSRIDLEGAAAHLKQFGLEMPGVLDSTLAIAKQADARVTPEAIVVSSSGTILYRGRIDNRFADWGKTRTEATEHDLSDALDRVLAGKPVEHAETKALGCAIGSL